MEAYGGDFRHQPAKSLRLMGGKQVVAKLSRMEKRALVGSHRVFICGSKGQLLSFGFEQRH